ncbi:pathogenesis-related thaumatin protein 3.5 [Trifolium repens]|nr:pathogenesis-related thaumatin protein 3.5 [Trifolium repens]
MHPSTILFFINLFFILFVSGFTAGSSSTTMTIANRCSIKVYPGILHVAGTSVPFTTGFSLQPGESKVLTMSDSWWGKLWGRTYCSTDSKGMFTCLTGECASSTMECDGRDSTSPVTFAEFNLNTNSNGFDYFGVSVVNGYNLPMMVQPQVGGGCGDCLMTSYATDTFHGVCVSTNYLVTFCPM